MGKSWVKASLGKPWELIFMLGVPSRNISDHFGNTVLSKRRILEECVLISWAHEIPNVQARV